MAKLLPPIPVGVPPGHSFWNDWYEKLRNLVDSVSSGLADLAHNTLQGLQGGTSGEYYHLTAAEYAAISGAMSINRIEHGTITLGSGVTSGTYTISPALSSMNKGTLSYLGVDTSNSTTGGSVELTNTTTVTARRGTTANAATYYFDLIVYN